MEQFSATVRNNADSAKHAGHWAPGAATVAAQGGDVQGRVVNTMQDQRGRLGVVWGGGVPWISGHPARAWAHTREPTPRFHADIGLIT